MSVTWEGIVATWFVVLECEELRVAVVAVLLLNRPAKWKVRRSHVA